MTKSTLPNDPKLIAKVIDQEKLLGDKNENPIC